MTQTARRRDIPKAYDPKAVEQRIYQYWVENGYFTPEIDHSKEPFVMIMPPPNVTGELHMGHALTIAVEDLMVRWHRMKGEPTLYLPGTDHAGIATQVVVERMLASDGITRHDLGRERFVERVWTWVDQYGGAILEQLKRLGASCDWTRRSFTLDEGPSSAVRTTFVNLYKKGLIYRGERITNWCPRCRTALSDLEVKYQEEKASLYYIRYLIEGSDDAIVVATTRPETLLGDTAVAVNPEDERYQGVIGKNVILPVLKRVIPVIGDKAVELEFGTGALKVTPGHDPTDFEIGQRHNLPIVSVMNLDGTMNENAGHFEGQDRLDVRKKIVEELEQDSLLVEVEPYHHSVGHCDRCDEVVEPMVSLQWYMKMKPLAEPARDAVADGRIKIVPERFTKVYFNWMDNIRDWCISRQLWWGHRIPVWYCDGCDEVIVKLQDPQACPKCGSNDLRRDEDVLDTWFSSGLWPHSTLGWPQQTEDLDYFYPGSVMETGYDILFFWVARMVMLGMENMGDIPFHTIYLHGLVLDPEGVKMSKTRGNVLDPLDLIEMYGSDALRFALTTGTAAGNNQRINEQKLEASRNFANKLWNASRYVMSNLEGADGLEQWHQPRPEHRQDRWILSRLNRLTQQVERYMDDYQFGEAQRIIHDFLWGEYCDWYLEMSKIRIRAGNGSSPLPTLAHVLERVLRLLHPFMPFITEEIWQALMDILPVEDNRPESLIIAEYPRVNSSLLDNGAETEIGSVVEIVRAIRNLRAEFHIAPSQRLRPSFFAPHQEDYQTIREEADAIAYLTGSELEDGTLIAGASWIEYTDVTANKEIPKETFNLLVGRITTRIPLHGLVDIDNERERLSKELDDLRGNHQRLSARLQDEKFTSRAPEDVVERERQRLENIEERQARVNEILSRLNG